METRNNKIEELMEAAFPSQIEESEQETVDFEQEEASDNIANILALQRHKEKKEVFD